MYPKIYKQKIIAIYEKNKRDKKLQMKYIIDMFGISNGSLYINLIFIKSI